MERYTIDRERAYVAAHAHEIHPRYRRRFHMCVPIGWMNDPNGWVFRGNTAHMFFQYYPYQPAWGPMHWGHVTSDDLVSWQYQPAALAPDAPYENSGGCFSGTSCIVGDTHYVMYTSVCKNGGNEYQQQSLAYSTDGVRFDKHPRNPVIAHDLLPDGAYPGDFRDPKLWIEGERMYCAAVSRAAHGKGQLLLYSAALADLGAWRYEGVLMGDCGGLGTMWECPDVFKLDGRDCVILSLMDVEPQGNRYHNRQACVMYVGRRDGGTFTCDAFEQLDYGFDFYAPETAVTDDGRTILVAWQQSWNAAIPTATLGHGWAGGATFPRELRIVDGAVYQSPVRELERYRTNKSTQQLKVNHCDLSLDPCGGACKDICIELDVSQSETFSFLLMHSGDEYVECRYDKSGERFILDRSHGGHACTTTDQRINQTVRYLPAPAADGVITLRILVDVSCVELFVNGGRYAASVTAYPTRDDYAFTLRCDGALRCDVTSYDILI